MPDTTSKAQYSLRFAVATFIVHGRIGLEHISGAGLQDAAVADMLTRISVSESERHSARFPVGRWAGRRHFDAGRARPDVWRRSCTRRTGGASH